MTPSASVLLIKSRHEATKWKSKVLPGKHKFCDGRTLGAIAEDGHLGMHPKNTII